MKTWTAGRQLRGTLRLVTSVVNWDADVFVGNDEALLTCESVTSENISPTSWSLTP
jgi:hypothetical protein